MPTDDHELMSLEELSSLESKWPRAFGIRPLTELFKTARAAHEWKAVAKYHDAQLINTDALKETIRELKEENEKLRQELQNISSEKERLHTELLKAQVELSNLLFKGAP